MVNSVKWNETKIYLILPYNKRKIYSFLNAITKILCRKKLSKHYCINFLQIYLMQKRKKKILFVF